MSNYTDIPVHGTPDKPRVVEIDAEIIAKIIMRKAHAREKPAIAAANAIADYLIAAYRANAPVS